MSVTRLPERGTVTIVKQDDELREFLLVVWRALLMISGLLSDVTG